MHRLPKWFGGIGVCVTVVCVVGVACSPTAAEKAPEHKRQIGLQLYSLRAQLPKDLSGTLAQVHNWGISDVEGAGFYGLSAKQFRDQLDKYDLHASGAHFPYERFEKDLDGVIHDAEILGCTYVSLAWYPHDGEFTEENARQACKDFTSWGRKLSKAGFKFTYHAHGYEFKPRQNGTLFDLIAHETDSRYVNFELDVFWAFDAGADPVKLMRKYPKRFLQMHLKDMRKTVRRPNYTGHEDVNDDVTIGTGQLDLPGILKEAKRIGIKHYYIEDESKDSEKQIPESMKYLRSVGF